MGILEAITGTQVYLDTKDFLKAIIDLGIDKFHNGFYCFLGRSCFYD